MDEIIERAYSLGRECAEGWIDQAGTEGEPPREPTIMDIEALDEIVAEIRFDLIEALKRGFAARMEEEYGAPVARRRVY